MNVPNRTIGLDARTVHRSTRRGTGKNLIDLYRELLARRGDWRVIGYHRGPEADAPLPDGYEPRHIESIGDRFDAWRRWRLPAAAWRDGLDLLHCPANVAPPLLPCPALVTVHDLLPLDGPDARVFERSVRRCVRTGAALITPSRFTADRLVERFGADRDRIVVNHWAADTSMHRVTDEAALDAVCERYGVRRPFVLHLGAADPRKNTVNAVKAFAKLPRAVRHDWQMLIVGLDQPEAKAAFGGLCESLNVSRAVRLHGFADEADMPALFSAADVLFYPSHSEGFGLPILDAFVAGTAVLCSNTTSLPEVGGEAVVYAEPNNLPQMVSRLELLLSNDRLRDHCRTSGERRNERFNWPDTVTRFIGAVDLALERRWGVRRAAA